MPHPVSSRPSRRLLKVVSGGQTGVDQAALRAARELGLRTGGWCPPGRRCEAGTIPERFPLRETPADRSPEAPSVPHSQRTAWNVRDSDATLILRPGGGGEGGGRADDPGTDLTARSAARHGRPLLVVDPWAATAAREIAGWLAAVDPEVLHVAGPRESAAPGIGEQAHRLLCRVLASPHPGA